MSRGHVRKRGKSWCFVVDVGKDPDTNRRLQRWGSGFASRSAAEDGLRNALNRLEHGIDPLPPSITLAAFIVTRWAPHLRLNGRVRPRTLDGYERLLRNWVIPRIGGVRLAHVMPLHAQSVLDAMVETGR